MSTRITAIIADDEALLRRHLDQTLAEVWPELEIVAKAQNGAEALQSIQMLTPDVAFLDIRMPELDGMNLAKKLQQLTNPPLVVFITAYDEYAVKAFEQNAVDYLLKPLNESRLMATCEKLKTRLELRSTEPKSSGQADIAALMSQIQQLSQPQQAPQYLNWVKATVGEDIHLISVSDILFFKAGDKYVSVFKQDENQDLQEFVIRMSLKELLAQLNPDEFWQIHRSTVVKVAAICKVKKDFSGQMSAYIAGQKLPVSRASQSLFKGM